MDMPVPQVYGYPRRNGGSAERCHQPSIEYRVGAQDYFVVDGDPQYTQVSYSLCPYDPIDNDGSHHDAFATQFGQQGETPRYSSVFIDESDPTRVPYQNGMCFEGPAIAPQDAAWSRLCSMDTDQFLMDPDSVASGRPIAQRGGLDFGQDVTEASELSPTPQVPPYHAGPSRHPLPSRTISRNNYLRSHALHNPVNRFRSQPMRRESKVMPIYVRYGPFGEPPAQESPRSVIQHEGLVTPTRDPGIALQPHDSPNNYWYRPASSMWVQSDGHA